MGSTGGGPDRIRVGAAGDLHAAKGHGSELADSLAGAANDADFLLLAGDLTAHGDPAEAEILAGVCAELGIPVFAVLGNHDWHLDQQREITKVLTAAGVKVLECDHCVHATPIGDVGIVGAKGFVGGFAESHLPDFGEPLLREVYAETSRHVDAIDRGLRELATCPVRIVLMHYSPCQETLEGEAAGIRTFLGCDRMAAPILEHQPDLVLHGHAHSGRLRGKIGEVPVFNVSVPVIQRGYWVFEFTAAEAVAPIH